MLGTKTLHEDNEGTLASQLKSTSSCHINGAKTLLFQIFMQNYILSNLKLDNISDNHSPLPPSHHLNPFQYWVPNQAGRNHFDYLNNIEPF